MKSLRPFLPLALIVSFALCLSWMQPAQAAAGPTATQIEGWLHTPLALFLVSTLVWALHGKKQTVVADRQGTANMTFVQWLGYAKETASSFGLLVVGFALLIATKQITDDAPLGVMFLAAVGLGIAPTQLTDLATKSGRSAVLADAPTAKKNDEDPS